MRGAEVRNDELKSSYSILDKCIKFSKIIFNKSDSVDVQIIFLFDIYILIILYNSIFKYDKKL